MQGFPPGAIADKAGREYHGWQAPLLPYVEQMAVYKQVDFNVPWDDPKNRVPMQTQVASYLSPGITEIKDAAGYALTHYAGNSYLFRKNRAFRFSEITDGTVNTILAGEAAGNFQPWGHPENCRDPGNGISAGPDSFGRPHFPPVAGFVMCDGSVRFLSRNIDPAVLKALATPAGGEAVELPGRRRTCRRKERPERFRTRQATPESVIRERRRLGKVPTKSVETVLVHSLPAENPALF